MSEKPSSQFVRLWTSHQIEVRRYVRMMIPRPADAEEVIQDVAVLLWEKWNQYELDRPFVPWAIRFAHFEVLKWRQRQAREKLVFSDALVEQFRETHDRELPLLEARRNALDICMDKLTDRERRFVEIRYQPHGSLKEEASRIGTTMHKLYYAVEKIRSALLDCVERRLRREGWSDA